MPAISQIIFYTILCTPFRSAPPQTFKQPKPILKTTQQTPTFFRTTRHNDELKFLLASSK